MGVGQADLARHVLYGQHALYLGAGTGAIHVRPQRSRL